MEEPPADGVRGVGRQRWHRPWGVRLHRADHQRPRRAGHDRSHPGSVVTWLTPAAVAAYAGLSPADTVDQDALTAACAATETYVNRVCASTFPLDPDGAPDLDVPPSADTYQGAIMRAAALYGRRTSQNGIAAFTELGGSTYVPRYDPHIALLLRIDHKSRLRVG